jgi:protein-tyrosine-phosphatase
LKEYASEADRLGDQLTACLIDLRARQQDFQLEHGRRLQSLERERRGLLERLQVIEDELAEQQDVLEQEVRPVIEQVRRAEFDLSRYDIPDPYGQSREVYQECADELKAALAALHQRLLEQR